MNRFFAAAVCSLSLSLATTAGAGEVTYTGHIRALVEARCTGCHGASAPEYPAFKRDKEKYVAQSVGPRMDTYAHLVYFTGWPDTGALMRRLDDGTGGGGKPGNMYPHLGDTDEQRQRNLALLRSWVGNWTLKRWNEITKEDLGGILVEY